MNKFGNEFKYQRKIRNLSQTEVAKGTGISQQNISYWEKGIKIPSIENCLKLAEFYEISLDELVGREFHEKQYSKNNTYNNHGIHNGNVEFK